MESFRINNLSLEYLASITSMKTQPSYRKLWQVLALVLMCSFSLSCKSPFTFLQPHSTPLPGWRSPTDYLFLNENDLPKGWQLDFPGPTPEPDPTINANARKFYKVGSSISVYQIIWRAYTIDDAQKHYLDRLKNEFRAPQQPIPAYRTYCEFTPPAEIMFRSKIADEFYVACGVWDIAYCEVLARYRNYVTILRIDTKSECNGEQQDGLTYYEAETIMRAMDTHFAEFLLENPISPP